MIISPNSNYARNGHSRYSNYEKKYIRNNYTGKSGNAEAIAIVLKRTVCAIHTQAGLLGVSKNTNAKNRYTSKKKIKNKKIVKKTYKAPSKQLVLVINTKKRLISLS